MATNAKLIDRMLGRLGSRSSERVKEKILDEINAATDSLEQDPFIPWFLQETSTVVLTPGVSFVELPTGFLREREETVPYFTENGKVFGLNKKLLGELTAYTSTNTFPDAYTIDGTKLHVRPVPTQSYTITLSYYKKSMVEIVYDTNEATNLWLINAFEYLAAATLKMVASLHLRNEQLAGNFTALEAMQKNKLYKFHESRIHENQDYFVGGSSGT